jgi:hypothetical protein
MAPTEEYRSPALGKDPVWASLLLPHVLYGLALKRTRISVVESLRLSAWAMAQIYFLDF